MAILIRTSDVPPAYRYDAWRSVVCDTLGPLDFRSDPEVPLSGEIEAGHLGPVNVGRVQTSTPHSVQPPGTAGATKCRGDLARPRLDTVRRRR
jgi:hypothetical protein